MILAAVDDLLFTSKICAAAKQRGVDVVFARSPEDVLEQARALRPALAIFDLNSQRLQPLSTIAGLKADASLASERSGLSRMCRSPSSRPRARPAWMK